MHLLVFCQHMRFYRSWHLLLLLSTSLLIAILLLLGVACTGMLSFRFL